MDPCPHSASPDSTRSRWCSYRRAGQPRDLCRARDPARSSPLKPAAEPGRMPRQDQRGECVFERGLGLAEDILHKPLKPIRCTTAVNGRNPRASVNTTELCMFFDEGTSLGTRKARFRAHLRRRLKEERRNQLRASSPQCAQFEQKTPQSNRYFTGSFERSKQVGASNLKNNAHGG